MNSSETTFMRSGVAYMYAKSVRFCAVLPWFMVGEDPVLLLCRGDGTDVTDWRLFDGLCCLHVIPCDPLLNPPICFCYSARRIEYSFTQTPWFRSVLYRSQPGRQDRPNGVYWHRKETLSAFPTLISISVYLCVQLLPYFASVCILHG